MKKVKKGCVYFKEERNEKKKWGEKGESYEKGVKKKGKGGRWEVWGIGTRYSSI